ncbi:uncharacterized protein Z520_09675 [Fonsecaea multimorphosa CBS 102226]|uniref:PRISE-like Rossmann-fold domain-containing protein n=1 Tax=Fonsecaea multimorphosa CBS 102226 TaxID=1442371 RepID=A0A0D2JVU1_9EURO|nr:uncharacterized protein Z520_09675 [Fonsecaea multimorphosa CBS 102226]KIX94629.1 hypothetical protein Z520_09675 [Fonsecaea multimorphosa CBS 102226]OAL20335.1 hypothetical protein AYO22_09047 [Fonsecaea multimorphosa]
MSSMKYVSRDSGIYHSLPQFDPKLTGLSALIAGANGISGFNTLRALLDSPQRWAKVFTLSRRPLPTEMMDLIPAELRNRIQHISCDLLAEPEDIAQVLKSAEVQVDYIFFYAYLQPRPPPGEPAWSNQQELLEVNSALLRNFLEAIPRAGVQPKRFLLQTGAKNYGPHIGRARTPNVESDPQPRHLGPNFYYAQEDLLFEYCEKYSVGWNVIRPPWIIGSAMTAQLCALYPFGVYAAVAAERSLPLRFPNSWSFWQQNCSHFGTALLTGYLSEWAVLEDKCKNQAFNSHDTSPISWDRIFAEYVRWFGVEKGVLPPPDGETGLLQLKLNDGKDSPMGYGPPLTEKMSFTILDWAHDPENQKAWKRIQEREHINFDPFEDIEGNFTFADTVFITFGPLSMSKARRLGWTGFVDTMESIFDMYQEMHLLGMLPSLKVSEALPLI